LRASRVNALLPFGSLKKTTRHIRARGLLGEREVRRKTALPRERLLLPSPSMGPRVLSTAHFPPPLCTLGPLAFPSQFTVL
jgi:hypothetical protein